MPQDKPNVGGQTGWTNTGWAGTGYSYSGGEGGGSQQTPASAQQAPAQQPIAVTSGYQLIPFSPNQNLIRPPVYVEQQKPAVTDTLKTNLIPAQATQNLVYAGALGGTYTQTGGSCWRVSEWLIK